MLMHGFVDGTAESASVVQMCITNLSIQNLPFTFLISILNIVITLAYELLYYILCHINSGDGESETYFNGDLNISMVRWLY